jgi:hypothetical protein
VPADTLVQPWFLKVHSIRQRDACTLQCCPLARIKLPLGLSCCCMSSKTSQLGLQSRWIRRSPRVAKIKSVPAQGREGWDAWEAPSAKQHRRTCILERGHAASDNKTGYRLSVFPILEPFYSQKRDASSTRRNITVLERSSVCFGRCQSIQKGSEWCEPARPGSHLQRLVRDPDASSRVGKQEPAGLNRRVFP